MKILILSIKNPFSAKDGGSLAILNVLEEYVNLGYEVTFLMMNPKKHFSDLSNHQEIIQKLGIKVVEFRMNSNANVIAALKNLFISDLPYSLERFYKRGYVELLEKILNNETFELIQFEGSHLGLYLSKIKELAPKSTVILRAHNVEYEIWERNANIQKSLLKKRYFGIIAKRMKVWEEGTFGNYDAILPISNRDEQKIRLICPNIPFHTLPFTIDLSKYPPYEISLNNISLAYLGALDWIPNQEGLMWFLENVWKQIESKYDGLNFYIAGRHAPDWLERKIKLFRVQYLGEIEDAKEYIVNHPIFVVPLMSGSGMRIKIIEQMALSRVILATSIAAEGIEIVQTENGLICDDADSFIDSIDFILKNPEGMKNISLRARETVENLYDSKEASESLGHFLKRI